MATEHAMATMEREATEQIDAALASLSDRLGLTIPAETYERMDARMASVRSLQRQAMILGLINQAVTGDSEPQADENADALDEKTRAELDAYATELGVTDAGKLANKAAVIAAIQQVEADTAPTDDADLGGEAVTEAETV